MSVVARESWILVSEHARVFGYSQGSQDLLCMACMADMACALFLRRLRSHPIFSYNVPIGESAKLCFRF